MDALRMFLKAGLFFAKRLAARTATDLDDKALVEVERVVYDDAAWAVIVGILGKLFNSDKVTDEDIEVCVKAALQDANVDGFAEIAALLIPLIQAALAAFKKWRENKKDKPAPTPDVDKV